MRIVTHQKLVKRNRQLAGYMFVGTFLALIAAFFFINASFFNQELADESILLLLQIILLPLVFILTLFSVRMTNLWARQPYPEKAIEDGLKGLSKKSVLHNYHHIPARHVLICPQGIFAIVTRWHGGSYTITGNQWKTNQGFAGRLFNALRFDGIKNPSRDAMIAAAHLKKCLQKEGIEVEVQPLVVMIDPGATLDLNEPDVPVLYATTKQKPNLKTYLRDLNREQHKKDMPLTEEQIAAFEAATL